MSVRDEKIVAGMVGVMMQNPTRVKEREWMAQQLTEITVLAGDFEADSTTDGVRVVQEFLQSNAARLLESAFLLFQRIGLDMAPKAEEGFTFDDAMRAGLTYLPSLGGLAEAGTQEDSSPPSSPHERELGEQPLALRMAERELTPQDLVKASTEQLTFKMVKRAMKGRRLTENTMTKVRNAWNAATQREDTAAELFNYEP